MFTEAESCLILLLHPLLKKSERELLFHQFGSAKRVLASTPTELKDCIFDQTLCEKVVKWSSFSEWQVELKSVHLQKIQLLSIFDEAYPHALKELKEPPPLLYIKGVMKSDQSAFAIVGTRKATLYGKEQAERIAQELTSEGLVIVSGFAEGIDRAAHAGALKEGTTWGILGSGLNHIYPASNKDLEGQIIERGALVSEFPLTAPPHAHHFPRRNRIVAALTLGVLVAESPLKGGSMITVENALALGRRVFALPGRVDSENFQGNHSLIKEKKAELVENSQDILRELGRDRIILKQKNPFQKFSLGLSEEERALYDLLPNEEKNVDELVLLTQFPIMQLNVLLTRMVLKKVIKEYPGKIFKKC